MLDGAHYTATVLNVSDLGNGELETAHHQRPAQVNGSSRPRALGRAP